MFVVPATKPIMLFLLSEVLSRLPAIEPNARQLRA